MLVEEIVCGRVSRSTGREPFVRLVFYSMDEIREGSSIIDEEGRQVVSDEILITACAIDSSGESMRISTTLAPARTGYHNRETGKYLADFPLSEPTRRGKVTPIAIRLELAVCAVA